VIGTLGGGGAIKSLVCDANQNVIVFRRAPVARATIACGDDETKLRNVS
jgi:hypothetical protein